MTKVFITVNKQGKVEQILTNTTEEIEVDVIYIGRHHNDYWICNESKDEIEDKINNYDCVDVQFNESNML